MKVYYTGRTRRTKAIGEYNPKTKELVVKKGSIVSENVASFKMTNIIKELRRTYVDKNGVLISDIRFNSPSFAASFVTGYSANGLLAWRVDKGSTLKDALK